MEIPLFPLHTVLCPGIVLPLHIFEERYRAMTRRCLDTGEPFGVVLIRDGREVGTEAVATLAGVGAFAEIREAGRYPDGRYDLLAAATGRFAIEAVDARREPFLVAEVTPLEDEVGDEPRAERLAATAIRRFVRYLDLMRARDGETVEALDIRVEIEASPDEPPRLGATREAIPTERDGEPAHRQWPVRLEDGQDVEVDETERATQPRAEHAHALGRGPAGHLADEPVGDSLADPRPSTIQCHIDNLGQVYCRRQTRRPQLRRAPPRSLGSGVK